MLQEIYSPTFSDILQSFGNLKKHQDWVVMGGKQEISTTTITHRFLNRPIRVEGAFICLVEREDSETVIINGNSYIADKRSILFVRPGDIAQVSRLESGNPFVYLLPDSRIALQLDMGLVLPALFHLDYEHVFELDEEDYLSLKYYYDSAYKYIERTDEWGQQIFFRLLGVFVLRCIEVLMKRVPNPEALLTQSSRHETEVLIKFLRLLSEDCTRERDVIYYAERLHISYKHFSAMIKRASKHNASEWIDHTLLHRAKSLIRYSKLSMQEIAYELAFSSPSHFSKFFRKHTGMTPSEYQASEQ